MHYREYESDLLKFLEDFNTNFAEIKSRLSHKGGGFRTKIESEGSDYVDHVITEVGKIRSAAKAMIEDSSILSSVKRHAESREEDEKNRRDDEKEAA